MSWKTLSIDDKTYNEIKQLAQAGHRTMSGTIAWLVEITKQSKTYNVTSISTLPHPPDAEPVSIVTIHETNEKAG